MVRAVLAVVVLALLTACTHTVSGAGRHGGADPTRTGTATATTVSYDRGVITEGADSAPVTIDIYEDYGCVPCAKLVVRDGAALAALVDAGKLRIRHHTLNLHVGTSLEARSGLTGDGALCVARDAGSVPKAWVTFHRALMALMADESPMDAQVLRKLAANAGATAADTCIITDATDATLRQLSTEGAAALAKLGTNGVPTVVRDGKVLDTTDASWTGQLR